MSSAYEKLGASASKAGLFEALAKSDLSPNRNYFCRLDPTELALQRDLNILHTDGAGTKAIVAYLYYCETGNAGYFSGLPQDAVVMNLDDVLCLGPVSELALVNALARDPSRVNDSCLLAIINGYKAFLESLQRAGISIAFLGGETADVKDIVRTLLVDATVYARLKRDRLISFENVKPGQIIIGLSSTGRASYELADNSGIASNGLTLARHALLHKHYLTKYPEALDSSGDTTHLYRGSFKLMDQLPGADCTVGEALLSPTRTYAPVLYKLFSELPGRIHGVIHNTGGGQTKVLRFGSGNRYVKDDLFPVPPLFTAIQQSGGIPWREMYEVFNMGHRLELYVDPQDEATITSVAQSFNIQARRIGHVEASPQKDRNLVHLESVNGSFDWSEDS